MSIGNRFAANDYGGVSGAAKHGIEAYSRHNYGASFGSKAPLEGMDTTDINFVGQGKGTFTPWSKLNDSPTKE